MATSQPFWDPLAVDGYTMGVPSPPNQSGPIPPAPSRLNLPWETFRAGSSVFPGLSTVEGSMQRQVDTKTFPGNMPSTLVLGWLPAKFSVKTTIWTDEQWQAMQPILAGIAQVNLRPQKGSTGNSDSRKVFTVYHPTLSVIGIYQAACIRVGPITRLGPSYYSVMTEWLSQLSGKSPIQQLDNVYSSVVALTPDTPQSPNVPQTAQNGQALNSSPANGPKAKPSSGPKPAK